jgi:hypothetical protein
LLGVLVPVLSLSPPPPPHAVSPMMLAIASDTAVIFSLSFMMYPYNVLLMKIKILFNHPC